MQVSRIGLTEPARLATPLGTNRKPVTPTRLRLPTKLVFPNAAAPTVAPARVTAPNAPLQARQATNRTPPSHTVGHPSSSRVTGQVVHPLSNGTLSVDNNQSLLQRKYNNNTATQRKLAGKAASTSGQNNTSRAKTTSAFLSSPLGQNPKCMLKAGSQELQPRAQMHTRQSDEAAMALAKPEAGRNAFTFRVSGAPDLASSSKHRAEMPASTPQPTRLAGASSAREVKQPAATTTTTTAEICAVVDASASLKAMPRRLSVGQGQLMSDPVVSMEECSDRLERLLQHVHKANEENAALKALKLPTTPKKPTLATSSTTSSSNGKADGSRRRTATVGSAERGQNASVRIQRRLEEIRARRLAREEDERKATAKDDRVALPMSHPTSAIQKKVERPRARREAREEKDRRAADACNPNSADTDDTSQDAKLPASKCTLSNSTSAGHPVNIGICTPPPSPPTDASLDVIHECDAYYALPGNPLEASIGLDTALQGAPMRDRALTWTPGCCRATILNQARKATSALSRTCIYAHNLEENTAEDPEPSPKSVDGAPEEIKWKCFHGFISLQYSTSQLSSVTSLTKITVSLSGAVITNVTEYTSRGDIQNRRLAIVKSRSPRRALAPGLVTGLHRMALQPLLDRIKELCTPTDK